MYRLAFGAHITKVLHIFAIRNGLEILLESPSRRQAGDAASNDCNASGHRMVLTAL
jgi:hypothetical protein